MSPGLETEQMLDTKCRQHIDSLKLGNSVGNSPSVANVSLVTVLLYSIIILSFTRGWAMLKFETLLMSR